VVAVLYGLKGGAWYAYETTTPEWHQIKGATPETTYGDGLDEDTGTTPVTISVDLSGTPGLEFSGGKLQVWINGVGGLENDIAAGLGVDKGQAFVWTDAHDFDGSIGGTGSLDLSSFASIALGLSNISSPAGATLGFTESADGAYVAIDQAIQKLIFGTAGEAVDLGAPISSEAATGDFILAAATSEAECGAYVGTALQGVADTDPLTVADGCEVTGLFVAGLAAAVIGDPVFISLTSGAYTTLLSGFGSGHFIKKVGHLTDKLAYDGVLDFNMKFFQRPEMMMAIP
jgi:hypothetical protein